MRTVFRFTLAIIVLIVIIAVVNNAGHKTTPGTTVTTTASTGTLAANAGTAPPTTTAATTTTTAGPAKIGTAWNISDASGDNVDVEVFKVLDPAPPASQFDTAPAGQQLVAVDMGVKNLASAPFTDDMNNDVTVTGNNSQTYTSAFNNISECTNFANGEVDLTKGATAAGCVSFNLPNGVSVAQVDFKPGADFDGAPIEWAG